MGMTGKYRPNIHELKPRSERPSGLFYFLGFKSCRPLGADELIRRNATQAGACPWDSCFFAKSARYPRRRPA